MYKKSVSDRAKILQLLVEGNSIRGSARIMDVSKDTVMSLLVNAGKACQQYHDKKMVNLPCKIVQVDELHSFVYARQKNVEASGNMNAGTAWTWVAIDAETKLIPSWYTGDRDMDSAEVFMSDLASRMAGRIQLTSDGYGPYHEAVERVFGTEIDFSQLVKIYEKKRYVGAHKRRVMGEPDLDKTSTSFVERQNLTMRMHMKRFTRKTNAFSKKLENHCHALALHFMHYNFCRVHSTLRITPAMAAGISDHVWSLEEIVTLCD